MREYLTQMGIIGGASLGAALLLTVVCGFILLPILRHYKLGQPIRAEGPIWHKTKEGTPTMGGLCFIVPFFLCAAGYVVYKSVVGEVRELVPFALAVLYALGNAAIGFIDDWCKLIRKTNDGLSEGQKFLLQAVLAAAYLALMAATQNIETSLRIPFVDPDVFRLDLGPVAYPLYLLIMVGFVNATNLTDGIDGLASSVCSVEAVFMIVSCFVMATAGEAGVMDAMELSCTLFGGTVGFLVFNHHPAQMFMGDTGSLFLGGVIMGCAMMTDRLLLFVLAGFVFVTDMLTSLLQRVWYKLTHGKRLFPIAPIHHTFEKWGWKEEQIDGLFSSVTLLLCIISYFAV